MPGNKTIIRLKSISVVFRGKTLLHDVHFEVSAGQCCGVLGPNGAGKSTLIAVMSGYQWPSKGSVEILGQTYGRVDIQSVRARIGLIESSRIPSFNQRMPVREVVATGMFGTLLLPAYRPVTPQQWQQIDREFDEMGIARLARQRLGELSTGERMKVLIARTLVAGPDLLILDEPTAGLDIAARASVVRFLESLRQRKNAPTLFIVSHHLEEMPYPLDKVILLKNGTVHHQGPPNELLNSPTLSALFDCPVEVSCHGRRYYARVAT